MTSRAANDKSADETNIVKPTYICKRCGDAEAGGLFTKDGRFVCFGCVAEVVLEAGSPKGQVAPFLNALRRGSRRE